MNFRRQQIEICTKIVGMGIEFRFLKIYEAQLTHLTAVGRLRGGQGVCNDSNVTTAYDNALSS